MDAARIQLVAGLYAFKKIKNKVVSLREEFRLRWSSGRFRERDGGGGFVFVLFYFLNKCSYKINSKCVLYSMI